MKNAILPARLKEYKDGYAVVEFKQFSGDVVDLEREEVLSISVNSESQNLPNVGKDVLVVFDNFGETHILGEVVSGFQPAPDLSNPTKRIIANDKGIFKIDSEGSITNSNDGITSTLSKEGKYNVTNDEGELIDLIVQIVKLIEVGVVPPGGGTLGNVTAIAAVRVLLESFKV